MTLREEYEAANKAYHEARRDLHACVRAGSKPSLLDELRAECVDLNEKRGRYYRLMRRHGEDITEDEIIPF
jgi:hypothetical protein